MDPLDAFWHVLNFFGPALGVGAMAAVLAKLLWRRELKGTGWVRLIAWGASSSSAVLIAGLVLFGHDGKMGTYLAMILACALALWWSAFGPGRRR